ncbi:hypothetical protein ACFV97_02525 [Streptomyces sp. NPDC059913]|uniref:hypothetical protein n=1 Tax=unclassified Streptomyces TaxID=2593676 RepID=UPI00365B3FA0
MAAQQRTRITPDVLRLRMQMRAAGYNPDLPWKVRAVETIVTIYPGHLADVVRGQVPYDGRIPRERLTRTLSIAATGLPHRSEVQA